MGSEVAQAEGTTVPIPGSLRLQRRREAPIPPHVPPAIRLVLDARAAGKRLDRALADRLSEHSRTVIAAWIKEGRVTVDGKAVPSRTAMLGGETVHIEVPAPRPSHVEPEEIPLAVLLEDPEFLVLDKPSGLTVHPGSGRPGGTLANALAHRAQDLPELGGADRPGIVHRLDRETSGVIVVALSEFAQRTISQAFAERKVQKTYLALVQGVPDDIEGEIDAPIGRSPVHRTKMEVRADGRRALTHWRVLRKLPRHALMECRPHTGRTHQIRVHMRHLGHPVVGDPLYGHKAYPGEEHAARLMLHALQLVFPHPRTLEPIRAEAPWPEDLRRCLEALTALPPARHTPR